MWDIDLNAKNESCLELVPFAVLLLDINGNYIYINEAAEGLFSISKKDLIGRHISESNFRLLKFIDNKKIPLSQDEQPFNLVTKDKKPIHNAEYIIEKPDGSQSIVSISAEPIVGKFNEVKGVIIAAIDVTKYHEAEWRTNEARIYAESIIQTIREPLVVLDEQLRVVTASKSFYDTFKVSREETEGRPVYELGNRQWDIPELRSLLEEIIPRNTQFSDFEVIHDFPNIGVRTMLLNARRINRENRPPLILLAIEDITERKQAKLTEALNKIDMVIHSVLDIDSRINQAMELSSKVLNCDQVHIYLNENNKWVLKYGLNVDEQLMQAQFSSNEVPITILATKSSKPITVPDSVNDPRVDSDLMKKYQIGAFIAAPLIARDIVFGMIAFIYKNPLKRIDSNYIDFTARLSTSVALALENARLYSEQHRIADQLQKALLIMPSYVKGVEFGYAYHSATEEAQVGGDFYDIFELEHNKVGVVIGDIAGKGIEAAALTSVVRNIIKAYAFENNSPANILKKTNKLTVKLFSIGHFVTVFFAILDISTGKFSYCNAGHPPAVIKRFNSDVEIIKDHSPVLGAFYEMEYTENFNQLQKGDILLLYTDGLIETRRNNEFYSEARLVDLLKSIKKEKISVKNLPDLVYDDALKFSQGKLSDDIAVLTVGLK